MLLKSVESPVPKIQCMPGAQALLWDFSSDFAWDGVEIEDRLVFEVVGREGDKMTVTDTWVKVI